MPYKGSEKERAGGRRRYERITAERTARGMCPRCGKARPAPDRTLCRHCGEKRRKAERARCAKAKAAGYHTAAETRNVAARLRVTGAGGAIGHGRTFARARAAAHIHPLKAARCANRAAWHGVTGSGNNMPCGVPPVCAAGAARRRPVMPPAATGAPGARPNAQEKRRRTPEANSVTSGGGCEGFA